MQEHPYHVGISTGFWYIGKDPALLGLATKVSGFGATGGVQFLQIDLETIAEFQEPEVLTQVKRMKDKLGIKYVGLHGEIGEIMSVDTAEKRFWDQTHERLVLAIKYAAKLGFIYVNVHFSFRPLLSFVESQQRIQGYFYPVVAPDGRSLQDYIRGNKNAEDEAARHVQPRFLLESVTGQNEQEKLQKEILKELEEAEKAQKRKIDENPELTDRDREYLKRQLEESIKEEASRRFRERRESPGFLKQIWLKLKPEEFQRYILDDGEFGAFHIIAHYMKSNGDYLWSSIAEGKEPDALYLNNEKAFCAAVASKYLEGHVNTKSHPANKHLGGMSIREFCEKNRIYLLFENPEANRGAEGANRLFDPRHYYHTIKNINSPYVKICIDVEHMVSHALDPDEIFPQLPDDFGKYLYLWHLGQPVPYGGTSHIPVSRASLAQEQIYRWMYWLKKKGWGSGFILFERGGGRAGSGRQPYEVFEDSVIALRQIAAYLEKDVSPQQLPPEFFGISAGNKEVWARQVTTIKEHAWDPLEGLLSVPEEKHTFFGRNAVEKGKAQEWEKRKFR
jgi:sugar phosphate isomerase/epimerase